jgi:hypothetical protein
VSFLFFFDTTPIMKINVLSLEDLSESQTDVVVSADLPEDDLEDMKTAATTAEEHQAAEQENSEELAESQSLIDQVVALEALYEKIASVSTFPAELAMEAYDAAPDAHIMTTYQSGASTGAKISVAMEGIMSKAWEAVKRFWAYLTKMWRKLMQYINRWMDNHRKDKLVVDLNLINKLSGLLHEGQQRNQHNQSQGFLLHDSIEENEAMRLRYRRAGGKDAIESYAKLREMLPKTSMFTQITAKYMNDLDRWFSESQSHPNAQTVMPAGPESQMHDFVEACVGIRKTAIFAFLNKVALDEVKRVTLNDILTLIKATVITAEYGLEKLLEDCAHNVIRYVEKRQREIEKMTEKEADNTKLGMFRTMGQELSSLREVISDVLIVFNMTREAQVEALQVGFGYLKALQNAYDHMRGKGGANYSDADKSHYEKESKFFKSLADQYAMLVKPKLKVTYTGG